MYIFAKVDYRGAAAAKNGSRQKDKHTRDISHRGALLLKKRAYQSLFKSFF